MPRLSQLRDPLRRAHQASDVAVFLQPQRQPLADVAAPRDQDVAAAHAGGFHVSEKRAGRIDWASAVI